MKTIEKLFSVGATLVYFGVFFVVSFLLVSMAHAQDEGLAELSKPVLDAVMSGDYVTAAVFGLILSVALVRRYGGELWPIIASPTVAPFLVLLGAFGAALANTVTAGESISGETLLAALKVAVWASGSYALLKPVISRLRKISPAWMSPLFTIVDSIFDAKARALKKAEAAGKLAVEESPGKGSKIDFKKFP